MRRLGFFHVPILAGLTAWCSANAQDEGWRPHREPSQVSAQPATKTSQVVVFQASCQTPAPPGSLQPAAPAANPAAKAEAKETPAPCDACETFDFSKTPGSIRPLARLGLFPILPKGCGYYSLADQLQDKCRKEPPKYPYPTMAISPLSQFDADWRFVDGMDYQPNTLEKLKRMHLDDNWLLATGGQAWARYQNEYNSRLSISNNTNTLVRVRPYLDLMYRDQFRIFVEGIFADSLWHDIPPLGSDVDRGDFQNLFVEAKVAEVDDKPVFVRAGRQEVGLGSQRLVGVPDWGNTRRTWDGVRALRNGEKWDVDAFWLQPVVVRATDLNHGDRQQNFAGGWVTYRPKAGTYFDAYYLMLDNDNRVVQTGIERAPFTIHTIGGRYASDIDDEVLWETEGALQLGDRGDASVLAGMYTGGVGYHFKCAAWNPTIWATYNYTSGDHNPNGGTYHTFNQLFPFLPYYMGWGDTVGRQNNHDLNLRLYLYPTHWATVWLQYHHFWLDSPSDALYNAAGAAYRRDPTGRSGTEVGQKLELLTNFHLTKRTDLYLVYSYLWGGEFLQNTAGPNAAVDCSGCYLGYCVRW